MNSSDARPIVTGIENIIRQQRKRSDSIPIITGIGAEIPKDDEENIEKELNSIPVVTPSLKKNMSKKRSRTEISKMEILKDVKDEQYDTCIVETRVISGIIENIEEEKVKLLIECFNPIIRGCPDHIKQQMIECSETWENKKEVYIGAINFIVHGRQNEQDKGEKMQEKEVETLSEMLIGEIENRMPKHCTTCDEWYIVKLCDYPQIHCMWCKVGMHDCVEMNEMKDNPGIKWLCEKCDPIFTKHFLPKLDKAAYFEGFSVNKLNKHSDERKSKEKAEDEQNKVSEEKNKVSEEQQNNSMVDEDITIIKEVGQEKKDESKKREDQQETATATTTATATATATATKKVCWFWENRKCRYGNSCKKEHPEQCKPMLEEGRCYDDRCKLIHVKICRNLFFKGYCNRGDSCWFVHPTKCNNQQNNMKNSWENRQDNNNQQASFSQRGNNSNFLEQWPQIGNNYNNNQMWKVPENQTMMQMMENMMQKIMGMDSKIMRIETGWQYNNRT